MNVFIDYIASSKQPKFSNSLYKKVAGAFAMKCKENATRSYLG